MTDEITDLKGFKKEKKLKKVLSDIEKIQHIFSLTQRALAGFKEYIVVQEIISILATNSTLLDLQKKKYEEQIKLQKDT